ncbi:hypothetical protein H4S03_001899 [Coemansia sp. S3946]|nr:hypothetical protein H4S03_001899 [Coemansia sp. S3946]
MSSLTLETSSAPCNVAATIRVRFPERTVCEDCTENDYEDIVVNVPKDTVGHVKDAIAAKLGIETDEFAFEYKYDTTKYKCELNEAFADIYMPNYYLESLLKAVIRVELSGRRVCEDCADYDYEDIVVHAYTDTIRDVKNAIASKLCIEADEFLLDYEYTNPDIESVLDMSFSAAYMHGGHSARWHEEYEVEVYNVYLYENKAYESKSGKLKWILSQKTDFYCRETNTSGQLAERLAKHIAAYRAQDSVTSTTEVSTEEEPWDGLVTIEVGFPYRPVCEDCGDNDYVDIVINALTDTVGHVKDTIASVLGIEADEFVFRRKYDYTEYESEADILFARIYLSYEFVVGLKRGGKKNRTDVDLLVNEDYNGSTGMLNWIMSQDMDFYCSNPGEGGQLVMRLAKHIAAYKAQHNVPSADADPSVESSIVQE